MARVVRLVGFAVVLWALLLAGTVAARFFYTAGSPPTPNDELTIQELLRMQDALLHIANQILDLLAPVAQFGLVIAILIYAAQRIGLIPENGFIHSGGVSVGVQPIIAVTVVGAFALSALTGLGSSHVGDLKDIALVVVGFYFGTRRRDLDDGTLLPKPPPGVPPKPDPARAPQSPALS